MARRIQLWEPIEERHRVYAHREVALEDYAVPGQYAEKSSGLRQQIAAELCLSAARTKRFDTLSSHLIELELSDG